jgi:hypothetical protein
MTTIHEYIDMMDQYYKGRKMPIYKPDLNALADFIEDQDPIKRLERELRMNDLEAYTQAYTRKLPEPPLSKF